MPVNLNQYRGTAGVFNNRNSAQCSSYNIGYNKSFQNCSSFCLVSVIFICLVYLFTLIVYLESSVSSRMLESLLSYILRVKSRTICGYLHRYFYMLIISGFSKLSWNLVVTLKKIRDLNLALAKVSPFVIGIWTVFLCQIITFKSFCIYS